MYVNQESDDKNSQPPAKLILTGIKVSLKCKLEVSYAELSIIFCI